jgi:hypothetical protein
LKGIGQRQRTEGEPAQQVVDPRGFHPGPGSPRAPWPAIRRCTCRRPARPRRSARCAIGSGTPCRRHRRVRLANHCS